MRARLFSLDISTYHNTDKTILGNLVHCVLTGVTKVRRQTQVWAFFHRMNPLTFQFSLCVSKEVFTFGVILHISTNSITATFHIHNIFQIFNAGKKDHLPPRYVTQELAQTDGFHGNQRLHSSSSLKFPIVCTTI